MLLIKIKFSTRHTHTHTVYHYMRNMYDVLFCLIKVISIYEMNEVEKMSIRDMSVNEVSLMQSVT